MLPGRAGEPSDGGCVGRCRSGRLPCAITNTRLPHLSHRQLGVGAAQGVPLPTGTRHLAIHRAHIFLLAGGDGETGCAVVILQRAANLVACWDSKRVSCRERCHLCLSLPQSACLGHIHVFRASSPLSLSIGGVLNPTSMQRHYTLCPVLGNVCASATHSGEAWNADEVPSRGPGREAPPCAGAFVDVL